MFIHVTVGSDTYGRVKVVNGVPVITKFAMLQFLPIFPIASFYFLGGLKQSSKGIPLLASSTTTTFSGLQLASVDPISVFFAYARGFFAVLGVVGFLSIVPGIMYLTGEFLDEIAMTGLRALLFCLVIGIVGGVCSYLMPTISRREREIRKHCDRIIGLAIDPARLNAQTADEILAFVQSQFGSEENNKRVLEVEFIRNRAKAAKEGTSLSWETEVDDLLTRLSHGRAT